MRVFSDFDEMNIRAKLENARKDIAERVKIAVWELEHPTNGKIALDNVANQIVNIAASQKLVIELTEIMKDYGREVER